MVRAPACKYAGRVFESLWVVILTCGAGQGTLPSLLHPWKGIKMVVAETDSASAIADNKSIIVHTCATNGVVSQ